MGVNSKELQDKCFILNNIVDYSIKITDALVLLPDNPQYVLYILESLAREGILKYDKRSLKYTIKDRNAYYSFLEKYCNSR